MLLDLPLSRGELDRAGHLRGDSAELARLWQRARIIEMLGDRFRCTDGALHYFRATEVANSHLDAFFLGLDSKEVPYFLIYRGDSPAEYPEEYESLRTIGAKLNSLDIGAAVHALALSQWHQAHQRCAKCGAETFSTMGGAVRKCKSCEAEHHPRTDPAVIVLVKDSNDRILLGRQKIWPEKRFSTFAGFVEPGESFESTVIREVAEECGGQVTAMRYLGSQPWPFPQSLMLGFTAKVATGFDPENHVADGEEILKLRWFTRDELKASLGEIVLPGKVSIARALIEE